MIKLERAVIAGTIRSDVGLPKGIELLLQGNKAIDAVEETIKIVEDNLDDWTVGIGGLANLLGEVELDASIMDGTTLKAGAVAGVRKHKNPISIARKVLELTPHVLLVGEFADLFADVIGFPQSELLTENAKAIYNDFLKKKKIETYPYDNEKTMKLKERYFKSFKKMVENNDLMSWYEKYAKEKHGTVNVIARDINGNICSGVSTSGLSFKFPGRAGDSPLIGAGNYADSRYGAAACVGVGEIAIRLSLARIAVYELSKGKNVEEAAVYAIKMIENLEPNVGTLSILVMDKDGNVASAANFKNYQFWMADSLNPVPQKKECIFVDLDVKEDIGVGYHR
ncbi:MAG: N(4)-(beta-N-acetylglucosaminyl)-L-asparaginase [Candidatus Heimdallarchaeum aukensis]|uniref:Plant-type L-asparaginase n=1 Tax=Candidatus Heimdallarchaeum aukensis TaxID=2876573 RepID=A0A9Y1FLP3_9ARCH|nr:MAG: N(4)-(beta-N-acetylglucosaminyl)-L-asparaginase [Candidatus Heimdallarchaeum aukensis]